MLVFCKTPAYSRPLVEKVLGEIDVERAQHGLKPIQATSDLYLLAGDSRLYVRLAVVALAGFAVYKTARKRGRSV